MTISRRTFVKAGMAAGTALAIPSILRAQTSPADARTVRMVKEDLRIFDPVASTANVTQEHGLAIYDTLFALDSKLMPQSQMVGKWGSPTTRRRIRSSSGTGYETCARVSGLAC